MFTKTLVAFAALAAVSSAATCTDEQFSDSIIKLTPAIGSVSGCTADSGFSMIPPTGLPTNDQYKKMCKSTNCKTLIKEIKDANVADCELDFSKLLPGSVPLNVYVLANNFDFVCAVVGSA
ncbi:hypothetical protein Poli38472_009140 [Pythium oligandrum]|uniref:Elicitin n=1 Tax=Pythium oligandrum TaxID=41045 RepID=C5NS42_PYTOL|nr:hypothetical protein Poli38472_009140 [Pythium oligandrum]BAH79721.1 extracellular elicitin-like proteinD1 [Pythium oligandrum]BAH79723.1 extracellular elicitin-like proteinS1 [Pythium oligandrum]|eukprot:TMW64973.1 hypothetical protein Poli38472_009140 [Pythium oligandrum]